MSERTYAYYRPGNDYRFMELGESFYITCNECRGKGFLSHGGKHLLGSWKRWMCQECAGTGVLLWDDEFHHFWVDSTMQIGAIQV